MHQRSVIIVTYRVDRMTCRPKTIGDCYGETRGSGSITGNDKLFRERNLRIFFKAGFDGRIDSLAALIPVIRCCFRFPRIWPILTSLWR